MNTENRHQGEEPDIEVREWLESLEYVIQRDRPEQVLRLLGELQLRADRAGIRQRFTANTPYVNSIPAASQPPYPGGPEAGAQDQEFHPLERDGDGGSGEPS